MLTILATLATIFFVFVMVCSIILIRQVKKDLNKKRPTKKETFIRENATRQLTEEEATFLQPYLDDKEKITPPYQWESSLINSDVTTIKGYIEKEFTDEISYEYYYKIGNIQLFFPYNMDIGIMGFEARYQGEFITKTKILNTVEIVFTNSYAIVVKINSYDLLQASLKLPSRKQEQLNDFWQTGKIKPIRMNSIERSNETLTQLVTETSEKKTPFEILSKREKNQFETALQDRSNSGKLMTVFFVLGVIFLLVLEHFQSIALVIFSIICFIFSLIASRIKRELPTEYVNHIKAEIRLNKPSYCRLFIDSNIDVYYPAYWKMFLPNNTDIPIDMQVELKTKQLLSCGEYLSISEEVKNYGAPKFVHHNIILAITGLILAILIFFFTHAGEKFDFTYQQLTAPDTTWNIDDKVSLKQSAIHSLERVNLDLSRILCDIENTQDIKSQHLQCDKIKGISSGNSSKIMDQVSKESYHNGEISKLTLSTDYGNDIDKNQLFSSPILINNFVFLFVILIALINSIIYIWKKAANQFRLEKIISHYQDKILEYND